MIYPKVLVIDDEAVIRLSIEALLAAEGYQLRFASNGVDGLKQAVEFMPDVILLDVMMPDMDGFTVCKKIRAHEQLKEVPVLIVTALNDREARIKGLSIGADDFLTKPLDRLELCTRMRTITRLDRFRKLHDERTRMALALRELELAYNQTIEGWSRALDLHDRETEGHSQRVKDLAVVLAEKAGIERENIKFMRWGALLHDVGKLAIRDQILLKPGKLTEEEMEAMKKLTEYAVQMLSPIEFLKPALDIPRFHHERWDGTGYPCGLKGEAIPFMARVFAIVDVWDALCSDRPYRPAFSREAAKKYITDEAGKHFDPHLVGLFLEMIEEQEASAA